MRALACAAVAAVAAACAIAPRPVSAQHAMPQVGGWLTGCWELRAGARVTHEHWMAPAGGMMLGMSRTVVRDTVREFESLRIESREGRLHYVAAPSGQTTTAFAATVVSDSLLTFENPAHDFPQRIIYRRLGTDSLLARIEGPRGGATRGIDFPMRRVACG